MASLPPPPLASPLTQAQGAVSHTWARWLALLQSLFTQQAFAYYTQASGQVIPHATFTTVNFDTKASDADGAVSTGVGWKYTVPAGKGGLYQVSAVAGGNATNALTDALLSVLVNGAERMRGTRMGNRGTSGYFYVTASSVLLLNAGDTVSIQLYHVQSPASSLTLEANAVANWVTLARIPGG